MGLMSDQAWNFKFAENLSADAPGSWHHESVI